MVMRRLWPAVLLGVLASAARAHEDLEIQIKAVTEEIAREPRNAQLFLRRGELHRFHEDWPKAQADYDRVEGLAPDLAAVDLARGRMWLAAKDPGKAREALDRFVRRQPGHPDGYMERGRALLKLGERRAAVEDFDRGMALYPVALPEHYVERAEALAADGGHDKALLGLDEGIRKLGPLVTLQLPAIELELAARRYDAALARLEEVARQFPRKEGWLARRGEILLQAGRKEPAREAFRASLAAIESLPASRRKVKATLDLETRVRAALATP